MTSISPRGLKNARDDVIQALGVIFANNDISVEMLEQRLTAAFQGSLDPNQPIIRISGLAIMGGVVARHKKPNIRALAKFEKRLDEVRLRIRQD